ncbi:flagellar hook-length control protein FliK [Pseudomonas sp. ok272]|uniref:flagellar hook-length control protein FliK n=1 Tax=unclassified Pseudomonas TaxID=196821 RepID=UPI0008D841EF|nr:MULTISPECIES: flagellar hook-length control protein FliK [unclassified Pseudomonas]SEM72804.1 flagellar hook-length control protein FliK [Pseudomonas sp. ok272]SFM61542.1 flagellar hook-length control protein FliK [Pseudomonas sp. ok602]
MPFSPNTLLQANAQAQTQVKAANAPVSPVATGDKAPGFAQVFANQAQGKPQASADVPAKAARDKAPDSPAKKDAVSDTSAASAPVVADSGKTLPAEKPAPAEGVATGDTTTDDSLTPVVDAPPVDPALDPAMQVLAQIAQPTASPTVTTAPVVVTAQSGPEVVMAAAVAVAPPAATDPAFDPEADPLDALPAVRLAMEQSGHVSASSQPKTAPTQAQHQADSESTSAQVFTAGMAGMLDLQASKDSTSQGGEKAFSGLIDDGLKDLKSATSDTRVDDFANRLAALTQAATPKTANALPVNQPIAMHQSGWTEEVVNRVMYLSSANLKAADIQLQPAELGRLDIRVNMIPDQQTQVTFMSAHVGVREALDGQMHRLREMFVQQGMGQVDVNVSDQSRGSQDQAQQGQGQGARTSANGGRLDSAADEPQAPSVAEVAASATSIIGSSAVDYYA